MTGHDQLSDSRTLKDGIERACELNFTNRLHISQENALAMDLGFLLEMEGNLVGCDAPAAVQVGYDILEFL